MAYTIGEHQHYVSLVGHRDGLECDACDRLYGDAFSCRECKFTVHLKCLFVFKIQEIFDHPCHDGHCLKLLTTGAPHHTDPKCHLCGKNTKRLLYHCSDCKLNLDIDCMIDDICTRAHLSMSWHHHRLLKLDFDYTHQLRCNVCYETGRHGYICLRCRLVIHEECVSVFDSPEITHPSHVRHSLKLIINGADPDYTEDKTCHICANDPENLLYRCDICKFNLDLNCVIVKPPPIALSNLKVHEHTLTLMPRLISFTCDACGTEGDRSPYVCVQCDFMIFHQECARLPRVIHVNHHDHRVSYNYPLGLGEWRCGVCWEEIDGSCGAYSCSLCPRYAIHSLCATRKDVWDGEELDGVPEEVEDIEPFKRNDDNTITHFTHEHNLMSLSKDGEESSFCGACVRPIGSYTFYKCSKSDCSFILHETCANLPKKKRHFLSPIPLNLLLSNNNDNSHLDCGACLQFYGAGFVYSNETSGTFDILCSSIVMPFIHGSHPHPLLYLDLQLGEVKTCQNCGVDYEFPRPILGCVKCNYILDFGCATLSLTVNLPRYDDHPLTLCYGEKASGKYWCDICERETDPETWFYICKDCGVTLHILCVVGDIRYAKPGGKIRDGVEMLLNNRSTRPFCNNCRCRCPGPFIIKYSHNVQFFCSSYCYQDFIEMFESNAICPPWAI